MIEILAGIISGSISGLGMGGGTMLILILSNYVGLEQHFAQAINLVFFIPTAISAIVVNLKQKLINTKLAIIIIISGIVGAIIGSRLAISLNSSYLRKYFGIFLLIISANEIYWIIKKYILNKKTHNKQEKMKNGGI